MITFKDVSKTYIIDVVKKVEAVKKMSFTIETGKVFGLLGPNGSGKTTTIKMILDLVKPSSGEILINNQPVENKNVRKNIGYLPENPYFYSHLTGKELIEFAGALFGMKQKIIQEKMLPLLQLVKMEHAADKPMKGYSKGMLQRIGIAQALINDPDIIILDEPMSGLDPIGRREVKDIILNLKKQNKTIIFCTHILEYAEQICDNAALIVDGNLVQVDTIKNYTKKQSLEKTFIELVDKQRK